MNVYNSRSFTAKKDRKNRAIAREVYEIVRDFFLSLEILHSACVIIGIVH